MTPPANVERQISRRASKGRAAASPIVAGAIEADKWFSGTSSKDGLRNFIAGTVSGFACKIVEYPFDTVKVLQQTQDQFKGPLDAFTKTVRSHGFFSLYQGLSSPLAGAMVENAAIFSSYGYFKEQLGVDENAWAPRWKYAVAGMGAGVFSATVLTPVELVKCLMQVQQAAAQNGSLGADALYKGPVDVVVRTVKKEGLRGLYRGHSATLMREIPGNFAWFGVYESVLREFQERLGFASRSDIPLGFKALAGSIGGCAYWAVPFPFDTAKSLMQTDARYMDWRPDSVLREVYRTEGIRGLYKGLTVTLLRAAPAHALIFLSYEYTSTVLSNY